MQDYMKNWALSAVPSRNATFAVIFLFALLMWNCGGTKETTVSHTSSRDSTMFREISRIRPVTVPLTQADLRLDLKEMANLTPGAVFQDKNGQASVQVERRDSIIIITATCDSLQILVESQYREITRLRSEVDQQATVTGQTPGWWKTFKNNAFYVMVGMTFMSVIILTIRIWRKIKTPARLNR